MNSLSLTSILSYVLAGSSASAVLVLGFAFLFSGQPAAPVATANEVWPKVLTLDPNTLTAKAAIVYDPQTERILFAKNEFEPLPLASLTKLMSAETILALSKEDISVKITAKDISAEGDWHFREGQDWNLYDLLRFGLAASSNDAMAAAAATLGEGMVDEMNREAKELGLTQTHFLNPTGLDQDTETAGGYGSARDVAIFTAFFLQQYPEFFKASASPYVSIGSGKQMLTATSTAGPIIPLAGLIGAKTGYTDLAGGNLVAAFDIELGHPVVIAVLGSTRDGRFEDVKKIIEALWQNP